MKRATALLLLLALAGCFAGPTPNDPSEPPIQSRVEVHRTCPEHSRSLPGGPCAFVVSVPTGGVMAQDLVAHPTLPGTFVIAVFSDDVANVARPAGPLPPRVDDSWLMVSRDDGFSWTNVSLPDPPPPTNGDVHQIVFVHRLSFDNSGRLHVLLAVTGYEGDGAATTTFFSRPNTLLHTSTDDLGKHWAPVQALGFTDDDRLAELASAGSTVVATGLTGSFGYAVSLDAGVSWMHREVPEVPAGCPGAMVWGVRVAGGILLSCEAEAPETALIRVDVGTGSGAVVGTIAHGHSRFLISTYALGNAPDGALVYVVSSDEPAVFVSHDDGITWIKDAMLSNPPLPTTWTSGTRGEDVTPTFDRHGVLHMHWTGKRLNDTLTVPGVFGFGDTAVFAVARPLGGPWRVEPLLLPPPTFAENADPMYAGQAPAGGYQGPQSAIAWNGEAGVEILAGHGVFAILTMRNVQT